MWFRLLLAAAPLLVLFACTPGPSVSWNSFVVHVVAEDCETAAAVGSVLLEHESTVKENARTGGGGGAGVTGWVTFEDLGCEEMYLAAAATTTDAADANTVYGSGPGSDLDSGTNLDYSSDPKLKPGSDFGADIDLITGNTDSDFLAVRVLRSNHNWTLTQPFVVQLGHQLDGTRFAVPSDSRLRIDFNHIYAGTIMVNTSNNNNIITEWIPANQWAPAISALTERQNCEGMTINREEEETQRCNNWRTANLTNFKTETALNATGQHVSTNTR